jgi:undecaprenyl diphosphate synthase
MLQYVTTTMCTMQSAAMTLCLAISYGGRDEITRVTQTLAQAVKAGRLQPEDITEELFQGIWK